MKKKPLIVALDSKTFDLQIDSSPLKKLGTYKAYPLTKPSELATRVKNADIIITNKYPIGKKNLHHFKKLKLVCISATGYNNIDLDLLKKNKIAVSNSVGYSTTSVAEHTLMFLLSLSHRFVENHEACINKKWSGSPSFNLTDFPFIGLKNKTIGIIGYGLIGKKVARMLKPFDTNILVAKIPGRKYSKNSSHLPLSTVLRKSDFVLLHCPLSPLTENLMNKKTLSLMKKTAYLINMARGPIVDEKALISTLKKNALMGYATDVMRDEPPKKSHEFFSKSLKNKVFITPHVAWMTRESRQSLVDDMAKTITFFQRGKRRNRII